jgi:hypothetical protein
VVRQCSVIDKDRQGELWLHREVSLIRDDEFLSSCDRESVVRRFISFISVIFMV